MKMKDYGDPAFPAIKIVDGDNYNPPRRYHMPGMTLRDYFAAKAMQEFIQRAVLHADIEDVAVDAYDVADQMLKARKEGGAA